MYTLASHVTFPLKGHRYPSIAIHCEIPILDAMLACFPVGLGSRMVWGRFAHGARMLCGWWYGDVSRDTCSLTLEGLVAERQLTESNVTKTQLHTISRTSADTNGQCGH